MSEVLLADVASAYREFVAKVAAGERPSTIILNRDTLHAAVIMEQLFQDAGKEVRILTGALSDEVYGQPHVVGAAVAFLKRGGRLQILTESAIEPTQNALLAAVEGERLSERIVRSVVPKSDQRDYTFHFAVNDRDSFRFEENRCNREASVQFGEPEFSATLRAIFDSLRAGAEESAFA